MPELRCLRKFRDQLSKSGSRRSWPGSPRRLHMIDFWEHMDAYRGSLSIEKISIWVRIGETRVGTFLPDPPNKCSVSGVSLVSLFPLIHSKNSPMVWTVEIRTETGSVLPLAWELAAKLFHRALGAISAVNTKLGNFQ